MTTVAPAYTANLRVRLGPDDPDSRYGPGVWHESDPSGEPICGQPCTEYRDRAGNLKPGTWEHSIGGGPVGCGNCARVREAS